ncbi:MAG: leucine-rich repeat domain-containing protein [Oscillospiraceae bacterium]|nr:leucine-rich repeat domain-containing protein [Oscillospiraceae bacterium]
MVAATTDDEFEYQEGPLGVRITGYSGLGGAITIPAMINEKPVLIIGSSAFDGNTNIASITTQDGLLTVEANAFRNSNVQSIFISSTVDTMNLSAFNGCTQLTAINVDSANATYSSIDGVLMNKAQTILRHYPRGKADYLYAIPSMVTRIGVSAFENSIVTTVQVHGNVITIDLDAFKNATNLTNVEIAYGVQGIDSGAFWGCASLQTITLPGSVVGIGYDAFRNCSSLHTAYFKHLDGGTISFGSRVFDGASASPQFKIIYSSLATGFQNKPMGGNDGQYLREASDSFIPDGYVDGNGDDGNDDDDENEADIGIDYSAADLIVPGSDRNFGINLTKETFIKPDDYDIKSFSTDGGVKWKAAKADTFSDAKLNKLFNKELNLRISDTAIDKSTKQPGEGAVIVTFPKINKRPKIDKLVVNYAIGADASGATTGAWVLTVKDGSSSVKNDIEVGLASGKTINNDGYGRFTGANGTKNGITILPLTGAKPAKTVYFIRNAPKQSGSVYTPASKARKINVLGEQKKPQYKINKGVIKYKANTYTQPGSSTASLKTAKGEWKTAGEVTLWMAATAKKPASAKQTLTITAPAAAP